MKAVQLSDDFILLDLKDNPIDKKTLVFLRKNVSSYEDLLNRRSRTYQAMGLKDQRLTEAQLEKYILQEYSFLKRPIFIMDDLTFIGNSKKVVAALKDHLGEA